MRIKLVSRLVLSSSLLLVILLGVGAGPAVASPSNADFLRAATEYVHLRYDSALESGSPATLQGAFSTDQGTTEMYIAEGFRRLHEQMGDYPVANSLQVLDGQVLNCSGSRATVVLTVQVMTSFSASSQRSCDEGVVATHTVDLSLLPNGSWSVASDSYSPEGVTAYLSAARAPDPLVSAAKARELEQATAKSANPPIVVSSATGAHDADAAGAVTPMYVTKIPYDRSAVVAYAKKWWNSRNTGVYNNYGDNDCANFVSQCTKAGGMMMFGSSSDPLSQQWWFKKKSDGTKAESQSWTWCPTQVDAWRWQHPGIAPSRWVVTLSSSKPSGYAKGDVCWKIIGGTEVHALVCTGFSGSTPLFSCHSRNHWNDPLSTWQGSNEFGVIADLRTIL